MEQTKAQLENEKKIQQLQMQAINALWKKVSTMQISTNPPSNSNQDGESSGPPSLISLDNSSAAVVNDLSKTCTMLTSQVILKTNVFKLEYLEIYLFRFNNFKDLCVTS